ncbi:hypothetical protein PT285_05385 [Lactobacillus sp. ESL0791]|nr:hypothetical protein [Lactobacillus sp. ESL0791]MDF7638829.1 hypothetical protein [Lactobacillus sp. ESL0791]
MVSIALFINDFIMAAAKSMTIMFYVSAIYFVIVLFAVPLLKDKK